MKSIYFVLDKNILPKTTTIEWKSAIISRAKPVMASCPHPQHPRDPLTITLEGSNVTAVALTLGSSWTLLYSGDTGLTPLNVTHLAWGDMQNFTNTLSFTAYRMIVTSQRGVDRCTQFSEMHLYKILSTNLSLFH